MTISLAALGCGLAAVVLGVVLLVERATGGDTTAAVANGDAPATAPTEAATTPAETPTVAPTRERGEFPRIGVPGDIVLPHDLAVLYGNTPHDKGGIAAWNIQRGSTQFTDSHAPAGIAGPSPSDAPGLSIAQDESGTLFASICEPVECMSEGGPYPNGTRTTFYRSSDGGLTWEAMNSRDGRWFVRHALKGEPIAVNFEGMRSQWIMAGSNTAILPPANVGELDLVIFRGQLGWIRTDLPIVVSESGSTLYKLQEGSTPANQRIQGIVAPSNSDRIAVLWRDIADERTMVTVTGNGNHYGTYEVTGAVERLYGFAGITPSVVVSGDLTARPNVCPTRQGEAVAPGAFPAILQVEEGQLYFIRNPFMPDACPSGATVVFGMWDGPFVTVTGTGSCLNVRANPRADADIVTCLADSALLRITGSETELDGIRWRGVLTMDGRPGWAASEFLVR